MSNITPKILPALVAASLLATFSVRAQPPPAPTSDIVFINGQQVLTLPDTAGVSEFVSGLQAIDIFSNGVVLFYQDAAMTVLSDQIWTTDTGFHFNFASDPDLQNLGTLTVLARLVETGAPQDVGHYFDGPTGYLLVQSDAEVPDTGTTCSLLGLSLMGLAFLRRNL